jgi:hypothetical protein
MSYYLTQQQQQQQQTQASHHHYYQYGQPLNNMASHYPSTPTSAFATGANVFHVSPPVELNASDQFKQHYTNEKNKLDQLTPIKFQNDASRLASNIRMSESENAKFNADPTVTSGSSKSKQHTYSSALSVSREDQNSLTDFL